jgi:hypothetical protein
VGSFPSIFANARTGIKIGVVRVAVTAIDAKVLSRLVADLFKGCFAVFSDTEKGAVLV